MKIFNQRDTWYEEFQYNYNKVIIVIMLVIKKRIS